MDEKGERERWIRKGRERWKERYEREEGRKGRVSMRI
jgi:hypothetical protein